jgi:hypothetical protein
MNQASAAELDVIGMCTDREQAQALFFGEQHRAHR